MKIINDKVYNIDTGKELKMICPKCLNRLGNLEHDGPFRFRRCHNCEYIKDVPYKDQEASILMNMCCDIGQKFAKEVVGP